MQNVKEEATCNTIYRSFIDGFTPYFKQISKFLVGPFKKAYGVKG